MIANYFARLPKMLRAALCAGACLTTTASSLWGQQPQTISNSATPPAAQPPASASRPPLSQLDPQPVTHQVSAASDSIQMIVNTSRILTQESRIPPGNKSTGCFRRGRFHTLCP